MTAVFQKIIFITGLFTRMFTCNVFTKESEPYLTIMVNNLPLLTNTIEVNNQQTVYVDCIAHPSHHSAHWLQKGKYSKQEDTQVTDDSSSSNIATLNLTDSNTGIYVCQSVPTKLEKSINVVAKKRVRRDDGSFRLSLPEGRLPTLEDALRIQKEVLEKYKATDYNNIRQQIKDAEDRYQDAIIEQEQMKAKKRKSVNLTVGITVGVLAIGGVLIAILYVLCRNSNRKPPTPFAATSVPTRTTIQQLQPLNSETAQSSYRPIETHIAPYPSTAFAVRPTAPTAVEPETPPPPSYTEVVNNLRPTAPIIST